MKVTVNFMGTLSRYTGAESVELELPDGARYEDLLREIDARYGGGFPEKCWNSEKKEFVKPIAAIGSNGDIEEKDAPLAANDEIHILFPISGGSF